MVLSIIPIQGTFDIARGRSVLRTHIAAQHWPPSQGARAGALLTVVGEVIIGAHLNYAIPVEVFILSDFQREIRMRCKVILDDVSDKTLETLEKSIHRAADSVTVTHQLNQVCVVAHLYSDQEKEL